MDILVRRVFDGPESPSYLRIRTTHLVTIPSPRPIVIVHIHFRPVPVFRERLQTMPTAGLRLERRSPADPARGMSPC
jgi:hypothetical protein